MSQVLFNNSFENILFSALFFGRFPFDPNNPIGYFMAFIMEYIIFGYEYFVVACAISLGIGIYWFITSSTKRTRHIVHKMNDYSARTDGKHVNRFKLFADFIYAHQDMKQLSEIE